MAEQLTIFGLWENVVPEPRTEPDPPSPPPPPPPIDPRQADLLSGPQTMRAALLADCQALDAEAVRARHAALTSRFTGQRWADGAPAWACGIEWLVGAPAGSLSLDEQLGRALELLDDAVAAARFPSLPRYLLALVRAESLRRAGLRLVEERGPLARAPNGEPAGWLLVVARDASGAREQLAAAIAAAPPDSGDREGEFPVGRTWSWLAEAEWLGDDVDAALRAYVHACLHGDALVEPQITCEAILDLFDAAADFELPEPVTDWIPAIADLLGAARLPEAALEVPAGAPPGRRLAAELALYRRARAGTGRDEATKIEAKRRMLKLAPPTLRELLRKI